MATDEEIRAHWREFRAKLHAQCARDLELYGPGYEKRREKVWDVITFGPVKRAGARIAEAVQGLIQQTDKLFDDLSLALDSKIGVVDRSVEPKFNINLSEIYAQDNAGAQSGNIEAVQAAGALEELYEDRAQLNSASAIAQAASHQVTQVQEPKTLALVLANNTVAHIQGYESFEEILAKVEYGFPDQELPQLLNMLRYQREGVEQVSEAFARQLFYRAAVRMVERNLAPETEDGIEADRLKFFALAIKGLRPDVDNLDVFKKLSKKVHEHLQATQYPELKETNVISIFNRVREPHVTFKLHQATDAPMHPQDDSVAPLIPGKDGDEALARGFEELDNKVVPLRPITPKPGSEDPSSNP